MGGDAVIILQPFRVSELTVLAGEIVDAERSSYVSPASPSVEISSANFGIEILIDESRQVGDDVPNANTKASENTITEFIIMSDSTVQVNADSVFAPGEDLSGLFMTDRMGGGYFEPRRSIDDLIGRNLRFDSMIVQLISPLERGLDQTFIIDITMDDGQGFSIQSNLVKVNTQ